MDISRDANERLNSRDLENTAVEGGLLFLITLMSFSGNLFLCYIIYKKQRFHTTANIFTLALTMCYGLIAILVMPLTLGSLIAGQWVFGKVACDIQAFLFLAFTWISLLLLILMTISRFFQVSRLTAYKKWFTLNQSYGMIMAIWSFVIILLISTEASSSKVYRFSSMNYLCSVSFKPTYPTKHTIYSSVTLTLYILLPILSLIVWGAMQRHKPPHIQADGQTEQRSLDEMRQNAEQRKTNRILLALILAVLVLWLPAVVINILDFTMGFPRQVQLASTFLWFVVPAINPVIHIALHRPFSKLGLKALPMTAKRQNKVYAEEAI